MAPALFGDSENSDSVEKHSYETKCSVLSAMENKQWHHPYTSMNFTEKIDICVFLISFPYLCIHISSTDQLPLACLTG